MVLNLKTQDCPFKIIAIGFIVASVLCAYPNKSENEFTNSLDPSQKLVWNDIQHERFHIYLSSVFVSLVTISFFRNQLSVWVKFVFMAMLTASLYLFMPKSAYMNEHLTNAEQQVMLRKIYRDQQWKYYGSLTLAVMSTPFVCR